MEKMPKKSRKIKGRRGFAEGCENVDNVDNNPDFTKTLGKSEKNIHIF